MKERTTHRMREGEKKIARGTKTKKKRFSSSMMCVCARDNTGPTGNFVGDYTQPFSAPLAQYLVFQVPEPATILLLAGGSFLLLRRRSR